MTPRMLSAAPEGANTVLTFAIPGKAVRPAQVEFSGNKCRVILNDCAPEDVRKELADLSRKLEVIKSALA